MRNPSQQFIGFLWAAYDDMCANPPPINSDDLERSITQILEPRIHRAMTGDEPFYVQHGAYERETMKPPPAQPPAYDLAFVLRAEERIMWPVEAKVMETPNKTAEYVRDIKNEFLTCRYAPFTGSGAMLGYLLKGKAEDALKTISNVLNCTLDELPDHTDKPNRLSRHSRTVPLGKPYPNKFDCYHLIFCFPGLMRSTKSCKSVIDSQSDHQLLTNQSD